jgi:site-specific DNA-methyltransferase (adenine-specific)
MDNTNVLVLDRERAVRRFEALDSIDRNRHFAIGQFERFSKATEVGADIIIGDCNKVLATLPDRSINCCVTSPPYFGLRDYGVEGQAGLEQSPELYVANLVSVFRAVRRVLRDDGTLWLNMGDSYYNYRPGKGQRLIKQSCANSGQDLPQICARRGNKLAGLKEKDLIGIPWRVAFALQADGWYLREDIIWHKPNPMPESVRDRCTKSHEYLFLLTKSERYYFDSDAIKEPATNALDVRNKRSVWTVPTRPYKGAHFATFPPDLIRPCVLAGCPGGGVVLDPFCGSGTTGMVALQSGRNAVLVELNPEYLPLIMDRVQGTAPTRSRT